MITTWSTGHADDNMAEDILVEQAGLIRHHPWWQARARLTQMLLGRLGVPAQARVLDAGCGWGVTLATLEQHYAHVVGMDISPRVLEMLDRERPGRRLVQADLTRRLPDGLETFDVVLALDVIEHIDNDRAAVERLGQLTSPGGVVIVSVPALPEMFSAFDRIQGHRRRYLPETLRQAFVETGLDVERTFWWGAWLVPTLRSAVADVRPLSAAATLADAAGFAGRVRSRVGPRPGRQTDDRHLPIPCRASPELKSFFENRSTEDPEIDGG
jgi:SAM-dependent methyltransferase